MIQSKENIWKIQGDTKGDCDFDFFITSNDRYCIYYSNISEYGMMKMISPVQIWTDRENPRLLFESYSTKFEYQFNESCYYLDKSDYIVLLTPCFKRNYYELLYVLFDFNKLVFTLINAPDFRLTELAKNLIRVDIDFRYSYDDQTKAEILQNNGKEIDLAKLQWYNINRINEVCSLAPILTS